MPETFPDHGPCRDCGHPHSYHQHYRAGSDCSKTACGCRAYKRLNTRTSRLLRWLDRGDR